MVACRDGTKVLGAARTELVMPRVAFGRPATDASPQATTAPTNDASPPTASRVTMTATTTTTSSSDASSGAPHIIEVLRAFLADPASASAESIREARALVASSTRSPAWQSTLADEARHAYNRCLDRQIASLQPALLATTHTRALCLSVLEASAETAPEADMDKAAHAKHWARTGIQFVIIGEADEAQSCLDAAGAHLGRVHERESVDVLEGELQLMGYRAHLAWTRNDVRAVLRHVEDAHALLEARGGGNFLLAQSRMYLSEQVAFRLARKGFELSELGPGGSAGEAPQGGGGGGSAAENANSANSDRRQLLKLLDLALSLLGGGSSAAASDALDELDLASLRDKILRLRAWLCMLEEEIDLATQSLNQHSTAASAEYMMLRCALLFKSNQPSEAAAQTLEWLRSDTGLAYDVASDAVRLLTDNQAHGSALTAVNVLSERLSGRDELGSPCAVGGALCREFSELQEIKYKLLTESVPDAAAAADHLETILDGHCSSRAPLEELTLRQLASKLWHNGCERYSQGDLHKTISDFETCFRFLEHTRAKHQQSRAQMTLGFCYLQQDKLDQAIDRAQNGLKILNDDQQLIPSGGGGGDGALDGGLDGGPDPLGEGNGGDDLENARSLARIVLVKARVKQGDTEGANAQINALLADSHDHLLLAAVCEELSTLGSTYHAASIRILESFVARLAEMPVTASTTTQQQSTAMTSPQGPTGSTGTEQSPPTTQNTARFPPAKEPPEERATAEKLAAAVRSLVAMRLQAIAAIDKDGGGDGAAGAASKLEMRSALLADLQMIARRAARDGTAVCDDTTHLEWLADQSWHLAWSEGQRIPTANETGGDDDSAMATAATQAIRFCADFVEASCDLTSLLPPNEARLHNMLRGQTVISRAALRLASLATANEKEEERAHLSRASKASAAAFRLHQKYVQSVSGWAITRIPPLLSSTTARF